MSNEEDDNNDDSMRRFLETQSKFFMNEMKSEKGFIIEISGEDLKTQIGQHALKIKKQLEEFKLIKHTKYSIQKAIFDQKKNEIEGVTIVRPPLSELRALENHCENLIEFAKRVNVKKTYKIHFTEWFQLFDRVDFRMIETVEI